MLSDLAVTIVASSAVRRSKLAAMVETCSVPSSQILAIPALSQATQRLPADVLVADIESTAKAAALARFLSGALALHGVVTLIDHPERSWVMSVIRAGMNAIISRESPVDELRLALEAADAGFVLLNPSSARMLAQIELPSLDESDELEHLTAREQQVLRLIGEGLGTKEIAARLGISDNTVKFHTSSILGKLGAGSRTEAVRQGIRKGLIPI